MARKGNTPLEQDGAEPEAQPRDNGNVGITGRGTRWERLQSWYLLSALTIWLYWLPFVYTGLRGGHPRWIGWGIAYGMPAFLLVLVPSGWLAQQLKYAMALALVISTVHALRTRGEFLERLVDLEEEREALRERTRRRREAAAGSAEMPSQPAEPMTPAPAAPANARRMDLPLAGRQPARQAEPSPPTAEVPAPAAPVLTAELRFDFNIMTERDFALLPDMGLALGRQAVALREQLGSFRSFDHFAEKMGLGPTACERLRPLFIEPPPPEKAANSEYRQEIDGTWVLDINLVSVDALSTLRGFDHETARRVVQLREADGPFKSAEDFRFRLGLSLDQFIPLQGIISTYRTPGTAAARKPKGRIVDV